MYEYIYYYVQLANVHGKCRWIYQSHASYENVVVENNSFVLLTQFHMAAMIQVLAG